MPGGDRHGRRHPNAPHHVHDDKEITMAGKTEPTPANPLGIDLGPYEEAASRVRELNERILESMKATGLTSLDAYEKALKSLVDFEQKVAGASQLEWVSALAATHASFVNDVSTAYTKAAREMLG
jgi:hypothetical protein